MYFNSISGGTGSGFSTRLLYDASRDYAKKSKINFCLFPTPRCESSVVEPYNAVLSLDALYRDADVVIPFDNRAIRNALNKSHSSTVKDCNHCSNGFSQVNRVIAQAISSMTLGMRSTGVASVDLYDAVAFNPFPE